MIQNEIEISVEVFATMDSYLSSKYVWTVTNVYNIKYGATN